MSTISTKIVPAENGHTVEFTIGVQTFKLHEMEADNGFSSHEVAQWYQKQLVAAFRNMHTVELL